MKGNILMNLKMLIKRAKCEVMYRKAVMAANTASRKKGGDIFYVLPTESGKLMILNRDMFRCFKKKKLVDKDFKMRDLLRDCVYHTNCMSQKGMVHRKKKFLRWKGF